MSQRARERERLCEGVGDLGVRLKDTQIDLLLGYLDRLYSWNVYAGLTSIARPDAVRLHLLDSLSLVPLLQTSHSVVDLGSGAGLPGIPLAVACPALQLTLVESRRKRCSFLSEALAGLHLSNCRVVAANARSLVGLGMRFDAVVGRAFLAPPAFVDLGLTLLATGGRLLIMGARRTPVLIEDLLATHSSLSLERELRLRLPGGREQRHLLVLRLRDEERST